MDTLNLQTLKAIKIQENDTDYLITAEENPTAIACSHCGVIDEFKKFGKREYLFMDTQIYGKRVGVLVQRTLF